MDGEYESKKDYFQQGKTLANQLTRLGQKVDQLGENDQEHLSSNQFYELEQEVEALYEAARYLHDSNRNH